MKKNIAKVVAALETANVNFSLEHEGWMGIELVENQWSWFTIAKDGCLVFDHTFSCNTGRKKQRQIHRERKCAFLTRLVGFNPCEAKGMEVVPAKELVQPAKAAVAGKTIKAANTAK